MTASATRAAPAHAVADLRTATRPEHERVERALDLMSPDPTTAHLSRAVHTLAAFWAVAEAGLDRWAALEPEDAARAGWEARRRAATFAACAAGLAAREGSRPDLGTPRVPDVTGTGEALGRLYVLEGSTLGGKVLLRHLRATSTVELDHELRCFDPYGDEAGAMWHRLRGVIDAWTTDEDRYRSLEHGARSTFAALARWSEQGMGS